MAGISSLEQVGKEVGGVAGTNIFADFDDAYRALGL